MKNYQNVGNINGSFVQGVNFANDGGNNRESVREKCFSKAQIVLLSFNLFFAVANIVVLCILFPRSQDLCVDYMGIIVGILAILVTVLVGWNVYSLIDLKRNSEKYEKSIQTLTGLISEVRYIQNNNSLFSEQYFFDVYRHFLKDTYPGTEYYLIRHGLNSIANSMFNNNIDNAAGMTKTMLEMITEPKNIVIPNKSKKDLLTLISFVKNPVNIPNFNVLVERIALIGTKDD